MAKRGEKHFAKRSISIKDEFNASSMPYQSKYLNMPDEMISVYNSYKKHKATAEICDSSESKKKLEESVTSFVEKATPDNRLSVCTREMVKKTLEVNPDADLKKIALSFEILEHYALRLIWYPWKRQLWKIKVRLPFLRYNIYTST